QNGEFNYDDFSITIHPSHFSKYGVFALDEPYEPEESEEPKGEEGPNDENKYHDESTEKKGTEDDYTELVTKDEADDGTGSEQAIESNDDRLPSTATNLFNWMLIGGALLVVGLFLFLINRKKRLIK